MKMPFVKISAETLRGLSNSRHAVYSLAGKALIWPGSETGILSETLEEGSAFCFFRVEGAAIGDATLSITSVKFEPNALEFVDQSGRRPKSCFDVRFPTAIFNNDKYLETKYLRVRRKRSAACVDCEAQCQIVFSLVGPGCEVNGLVLELLFRIRGSR